MNEGARFCSFCGTPVNSASAARPADGGGEKAGAVTVEIKKPPKKKGKGKIVLIVALAAALWIAALVMIGIFMMPEGMSPQAGMISAYISKSGDAYLCYGAGKYVKIEEGHISKAYLSPNREHIVYVTVNGELVYTDIEQKDTHSIDVGDMISVSSVRDTFVVYDIVKNGDESWYLYDYDTGATEHIVSFNEASSVTRSSSYDECGAVAYVSVNEVYVKAFPWRDLVRIATLDTGERAQILGVSADGNAVLWKKKESAGGQELYLYYYGENERIDSDDIYDTYYFNAPADTSDIVVITAPESGQVFIKEKGKDTVEQNIGDTLYYSAVMNAKGNTFYKDPYFEANGFYVASENREKEGFILNYVNLDGSYREVIKGILSMSFVGEDGIVCLSVDFKLYYAELDVMTGKLKGEMQLIDDEVSDLKVNQAGGDHIYYRKELTDLYSYSISRGESEKVASGVDQYYVSTDGECVFYLKDTTHQGGYVSGYISIKTASLHMYDSVADASERIDDNVLTDSVTSNLISGEIDREALWFETFGEFNAEGYTCNAKVYTPDGVRDIILNILK